MQPSTITSHCLTCSSPIDEQRLFCSAVCLELDLLKRRRKFRPTKKKA